MLKKNKVDPETIEYYKNKGGKNEGLSYGGGNKVAFGTFSLNNASGL